MVRKTYEVAGVRIRDGIILNPDCECCGMPHTNLEHSEDMGMYLCVCGCRTPDDLLFTLVYGEELENMSEGNNIYKENGFNNRKEYVLSLAEEYGLDSEIVITLANLLGPSEDFDGLVVACQDAAGAL